MAAEMEPNDKTAFSNSSDEVLESNKKINLSNEKSKFKKSGDKPPPFDEMVKNKVNASNDRNSKAFELGKKFLSILNDKTLPENKGPIVKNVESQVCIELFNLAQEINNDPSEPESAGSAMLDTLFFKSLLMLRDKINKIEYHLINELPSEKYTQNK